MIFTSNSPKETQKIAADLAHEILKTKKGAVIALEGELGAGKTVFVKGFAKALGIKSKIKSPTFVLMKKYNIPQNTTTARSRAVAFMAKYKIQNLYHLDCYRVKDHKDLKILELDEIFKVPQNIILIEWAERVRKILPKKHLTVHIDHVDKNTRKIKISNYSNF